MIKKKDIIDYFWTFGNFITTEKGVELEMHGDSLIEVSMLLRNVEDIEINGLVPMIQVRAFFEDFQHIQHALGIEKLEDFKYVTMAGLMRLYAAGLAKMEEINY